MKNRLLFVTVVIALYMGIQTLRADDPKICSQGHSLFGKVTCGSVSSPEPLLDAYFLGAGSLDEVQKAFPERFEKIRQKCERKVVARQLASAPKGAAIEREEVQFRVQTIVSCVGKRGYQEPCVKNEDCIENFCHPDRGTCSVVFTVPLGTAQ